MNRLVCLYLWPAASMTTGGARDVSPGVRNNIVSVFLSNIVRPAAAKTVTMTHHISKALCRPRNNSCVTGVQHAPHCPSHAGHWDLVCDRYTLLEVDHIPNYLFVLTEAYY